jgi:hypothetical protein
VRAAKSAAGSARNHASSVGSGILAPARARLIARELKLVKDRQSIGKVGNQIIRVLNANRDPNGRFEHTDTSP